MIATRPCLARRPPRLWVADITAHRLAPFARLFHSSIRDQNHYETLDVDPAASPGEIKKQFYKLSKSYHPDLHPNDPNASHRFIQISEAYATLGSPDKRALYDRDILRLHQQASSSSRGPGGSYSSASTTPFGGRAASGLSRRRTQFRGPPPSFYSSGGWGQQGEKRSEHASKASHTHEAQGKAQSNDHDVGGGMGPGGFAQGYDNDVPHFDQRAHTQTHSNIERTRHKARRKREVRVDEPEEGGGSSTLFNFAWVSGMFFLIYLMSGTRRPERPAQQREEGT